MKTITLDIETIPTQRSDLREYIAATVKPPATYKKAESIAEWHKEQGPAAIEEAVSKTGLDGAFGQIVVIGMAIGNAEPVALSGLNEPALLAELNEWFSVIHQSEWYTTSIVGHNVAGFDLRFLLQRYIVNGIKPHPIIARAAQAKPWESEKVFDTMVQFAGVGNRISLDKLCLALSIPSPKSDMDGSMVGQYVKDGRLAEVVEYCKNDVAATREAYKRMTFA